MECFERNKFVFAHTLVSAFELLELAIVKENFLKDVQHASKDEATRKTKDDALILAG